MKSKKVKIKKICKMHREWLEKNQIFIQTTMAIASTLIAIASVLIAYQSIRISKQQNDITMIQNMPRINVFNEITYNEKEKYYDQNTIIINNSGGDLSEFQGRIATFYEIEYLNDKDERAIIEIPVSGTYSAIYGYNNVSGNLMTATAINNREKLDKLRTEAYEFYNNKHSYMNITEINYIRTTYKDIFNKPHIEYHRLRNDLSSKIEKSEGDKIFETYDGTPLKHGKIDYNNMTLSDIKDIVKNERE